MKPDFSSPRPWHVLVAPSVPILALLGGNFAGIVIGGAIRPIAAATVAAFVLWLILSWVTRRPRSAGLAVTLFMLVALSQATIARVAAVLNFPSFVLLVTVSTIVICIFILLYGQRVERWTTFVNALMLWSAGLMLVPIAHMQYRVWRAPTQLPDPFQVVSAPASRPDVYVLILDGYGRQDVLRDRYGFENTMISALRQRGFNVASGAASNYAQTAQSLASSLNAEYLPSMFADQTPESGVPTRQRLADLVARSRSFAAFRQAGYRIRAYQSEYGLIQPADVDERLAPSLYFNDFEFGLHEGSIIPLVAALSGFPPGALGAAMHRRHVLWTLDHLEQHQPAAGDPPTLTFAHVIVPHPPFLFEPDGQPRRSKMPANLYDGNHWRLASRGTGESYQDGYVRSLRFINLRLERIIDGILARSSGRPTVIYLQGDHGPGSQLEWEEPQKTDFRERLGILMAVRMHREDAPTLYPEITPVNSMRVLLNAALGLQLPKIDDRSYFSRWSMPLVMDDVTDRVRATSDQ